MLLPFTGKKNRWNSLFRCLARVFLKRNSLLSDSTQRNSDFGNTSSPLSTVSTMDTNSHKKKVLAYITRQTKTGPELLIFAHRDYPEAGLQVPGGTLDQGEDPLTGVLREVKEETGLEHFTSVKLLGETEYVATKNKEIHLRRFFYLTYGEACETTFVHTVTAGEEDQGLVFLYQWVPLGELPELAGEQGAMLADIVRS
jgi:8-oxo-dGTP pyrophosphatase MutT (NUDIX family)